MRIIRIIINVCIPIFLLMLFASILTTKPYLMLSKGLYHSHERIDFDHEYAVDRIIGYLNYQYDDLNFGSNEDDNEVIMRDIEISHMVDVKNLYTTLRIVAISAGAVALGLCIFLYYRNKNQLYRTIKTLPIGPIFFTMFLGGYFIIDFRTAFNTFHEMFFTNDDWLLRSTDVLILLLPLNFWLVSASIILVLFASTLGLMYWINEKTLGKNA